MGELPPSIETTRSPLLPADIQGVKHQMKVQIHGTEEFKRLFNAYRRCRGSAAGELMDNPNRTGEWLLEDSICRIAGVPDTLRRQAIEATILGFRKCIEEGGPLLYSSIYGEKGTSTLPLSGRTEIRKDSVVLPHFGEVSLVSPNDGGSKILQQVTVFEDEEGLYWIYYEE